MSDDESSEGRRGGEVTSSTLVWSVSRGIKRDCNTNNGHPLHSSDLHQLASLRSVMYNVCYIVVKR